MNSLGQAAEEWATKIYSIITNGCQYLKSESVMSILKRAWNKLILKLGESRVKTIESYLRGPGRPLSLAEISRARADLECVHKSYTNEVSRADMAASLELSAFLLAWCRVKKPERLLDLGSGFTSYVFRLYAREEPGVYVTSVDDDEIWLEKTRDFLIKHRLSTQAMTPLSGLLTNRSPHQPFDLVVQDMNFVEVRIGYTSTALDLAKGGGTVIFDDTHKPDYRRRLLSCLMLSKNAIYSLKELTLDSYGRYAFGLVKAA